MTAVLEGVLGVTANEVSEQATVWLGRQPTSVRKSHCPLRLQKRPASTRANSWSGPEKRYTDSAWGNGDGEAFDSPFASPSPTDGSDRVVAWCRTRSSCPAPALLPVHLLSAVPSRGNPLPFLSRCRGWRVPSFPALSGPASGSRFLDRFADRVGEDR